MSAKSSLKIVLVIATLGGGGAERVMSLLATEWINRGNQVTMITLDGTGNDHYSLPASVKRVGLDAIGVSRGKLDALKRNTSRLLRLRAAIRAENPDVVISFLDVTNVLTLLATRGMNVPVLVSERSDPTQYSLPAGWDLLRKKLYPRATAVVVQSQSIADWAYGIVDKTKVHIIANPVQLELSAKSKSSAGLVPGVPDEVLEKTFILTVGRLHEQKGIDLLLTAFAEIPADEDVRLIILGEGPEREALTKQVGELGISDRVYMPGRIDNPVPVLERAEVFVLPSRVEGFPNALLEAMAVGLPVISFDCPSGPRHIIANRKDGILVEAENAGKLSEAMALLLGDDALRNRLGSEAKKAMSRYSLSNITDEWEQLFN